MYKRLIIIAAVFPLLFNSQAVCAEKKPLFLRAGSALVEAKVYPFKGPTEGLEPTMLLCGSSGKPIHACQRPGA